MINLENLKSVRFLVGEDGRPSAVQMDIETWESLLDWLEDTEDRQLVKEMLPRLRKGPKTTALHWDAAKSAWDNVES